MTEFNGAMLQCFHWYSPGGGKLWQQITEEAPQLAKAGFTALWLPPAFKGVAGGMDVGYGVYDLFDLGEFDQKGSVATRYGTRDQYLKAINAAKEAGIQVYADVVFNHKLGADHQEEFMATPYKPDNRKEAAGEQQTIRAWTHFTFPGRGGKYSELQWHWWHFNAADHNVLDQDTDAVYLFEGKEFNESVDQEKGNFDYLMGCNLDIASEDVRKELFYWGEWFLKTTGVDGFRFDAVKHVNSGFFLEWLNHMRGFSGRDLFAVGEYWSGNMDSLMEFIEKTGSNIMLFDVVLQHNFAAAGNSGREYDLRAIFDNTLVSKRPDLAVTIVSNHDTQPLQALESVVQPWFKPIAYALILLRKDGYPCVFAADYYGASYTDRGKDGGEYDIEMASHRFLIDKFLEVRSRYAYGEQIDCFEDAGCIGWTRKGNTGHPGGMAVVISNNEASSLNMETGSPGTTYIDITEHIDKEIKTNSDGRAEFSCPGGSVSVWVPKQGF